MKGKRMQRTEVEKHKGKTKGNKGERHREQKEVKGGHRAGGKKDKHTKKAIKREWN
jgi:hypothetical protein